MFPFSEMWHFISYPDLCMSRGPAPTKMDRSTFPSQLVLWEQAEHPQEVLPSLFGRGGRVNGPMLLLMVLYHFRKRRMRKRYQYQIAGFSGTSITYNNHHHTTHILLHVPPVRVHLRSYWLSCFFIPSSSSLLSSIYPVQSSSLFSSLIAYWHFPSSPTYSPCGGMEERAKITLHFTPWK